VDPLIICQNFKINTIDLITAAALRVGSASTISRKAQLKKQLLVKPTIVKLLRTVPFESGFHFYTALGNYTGITATNLSEFAAKLKTIPMESITFHFQRNDFQNWIKYTIKDAEIAERINRAKGAQSTEDLRKEILRILETRTAHAF